MVMLKELFAGIISQLPTTLASLGTSLVDTTNGSLQIFNWFTLPLNPTATWVAVVIGLASLLVLYLYTYLHGQQ